MPAQRGFTCKDADGQWFAAGNEEIPAIFNDDIVGLRKQVPAYKMGNGAGYSSHGTYLGDPGSLEHILNDGWGQGIKGQRKERLLEIGMELDIGFKVMAVLKKPLISQGREILAGSYPEIALLYLEGKRNPIGGRGLASIKSFLIPAHG